MLRRPTRSTSTDTLFPYTTLFRSVVPHRRRIGPWSGSHQLAGVASDNGEPAGQPVQAVVAGQHSLVAPRATHGAGDTLQDPARSEERRGGKECVSTCRSRCSPYH